MLVSEQALHEISLSQTGSGWWRRGKEEGEVVDDRLAVVCLITRTRAITEGCAEEGRQMQTSRRTEKHRQTDGDRGPE